MIYIGDLSRADAAVLADFASKATVGILEFGVGASTQIFGSYASVKVVSVDSSKEWIRRTINNFALLGIPDTIEYHDFFQFLKNKGVFKTIPPVYDLIFNDGDPFYRLQFAQLAWGLLAEGGNLLFHDTRKLEHVKDVARFFSENARTIGNIQTNVADSNITVIRKCAALPYEDWNVAEGRQQWEFGPLTTEIPQNAREILLKRS